MNKFDFSKVSISSHIHFIGVGGISMSALASILLKKGYKVTGSDTSDSKYIKALRNMGAGIFIGHAKENAIGSDVVVYSSAIKADNPERAYAEENNIPCIERSVLLGSIEKMYKYPVDVAGTHGKTSTTGMLSHIFIAADKNPTILIGGELPVI
ncbi:MAG: Mur ligase domain-containing protein, partial [Bacillota bacterium]|nr:Mur ligase domain-containing protein [Bacillota bacterium]